MIMNAFASYALIRLLGAGRSTVLVRTNCGYNAHTAPTKETNHGDHAVPFVRTTRNVCRRFGRDGEFLHRSARSGPARFLQVVLDWTAGHFCDCYRDRQLLNDAHGSSCARGVSDP